MHLDPPFDRLDPRAAEGAGPSRAVTVTLPGDLAAWLETRCASDAERSNLVATALDAARRFDTVGRWPDPPPKPRPTPEQVDALRAELEALADPDAEPDGFDEWLEEREAERDRLTTRAEAVKAANAPYGKSAEEVLAWIHALPDDLPGETPMEEIVRDIYRRPGYPMDKFRFGPDAGASPADDRPADVSRKAA